MSQTVVNIKAAAGEFAENKDIARELRLQKIMPALERQQEVILDFDGVRGVTQSFVHALISEAMRQYGSEVLDVISFTSCTETVQKVISIVVDYMQES